MSVPREEKKPIMGNPGHVLAFFRSDRELMFTTRYEDVLRLAAFLAITYPEESWHVAAIRPFEFPSGEIRSEPRPYESQSVWQTLEAFGWVTDGCKNTMRPVQPKTAAVFAPLPTDGEKIANA